MDSPALRGYPWQISFLFSDESERKYSFAGLELTGLTDESNVYYLGPEGTHTHEAAWQFANRFGLNSSSLIPEASIGMVIDRIAPDSGAENDYACVPLENSIQGSVTITWDRLFRILYQESKGEGSFNSQVAFTNPLSWRGFGIRAVLTLPIAHYVLSNGRLKPESVSHVYSHPQALAQCKVWLERNMPHAVQMAVSSTAEAARLVYDSEDSTKVAIGSSRAGETYGLSTSPSPIQDFDYNFTRFGLLANTQVSFAAQYVSRYVTSLCLSGVQNQPGGLLKALSPFYENKLNLTRIESRPVGHALGTYVFYLDVETDKARVGPEWSNAWEVVLGALLGEGVDVVHLGTYPILD